MDAANNTGELLDARQHTRQIIFEAFARLFASENYADITVRQIIREAGIGHSTFYDHYASKEALLDDLCAEMFQHISSDFPNTWYAADAELWPGELIATFAHLLYHLREDNSRLRGLLTGASAGLFLRKIEPYLRDLLRSVIEHQRGAPSCPGVPEDFVLNHLVGGFNAAVKWWVAHDFAQSPQVIAGYLQSMLPTAILESNTASARAVPDESMNVSDTGQP